MASYAHSAIDYIKKLIHIQQHIPAKYIRRDEKTIKDCMRKLKPLVENNHYTDNQARNFWSEKRWMIRTLIPSVRYPGFAKLISEFAELDETEVWNSVTRNL
jgi:hypothetical protein